MADMCKADPSIDLPPWNQREGRKNLLGIKNAKHRNWGGVSITTGWAIGP